MPEVPVITTAFIDWGRTIHHFALDLWFNWLERKFGVPRRHFWDMFSHNPNGLLYAYECGQSTGVFFRRFKAALNKLAADLKREGVEMISWDLGSSEFYEEFLDNWIKIVSSFPDYPDALTLLEKLKSAGLRVYILSNTNPAHLAWTKKSSRDLLRLVDRFIASCDSDVRCRKVRISEGMRFSDATRIYRKALVIARCDHPGKAVLLDDVFDFPVIFRGMGGNGIQFTGCWTKVEAEFSYFGIKL